MSQYCTNHVFSKFFSCRLKNPEQINTDPNTGSPKKSRMLRIRNNGKKGGRQALAFLHCEHTIVTTAADTILR